MNEIKTISITKDQAISILGEKSKTWINDCFENSLELVLWGNRWTVNFNDNEHEDRIRLSLDSEGCLWAEQLTYDEIY